MIDPAALYKAQADAIACLGAPYLWGGKWPTRWEPSNQRGVDCSGFSKWVVGRAGIVLPDGADGQYRVCKPWLKDPRLLDLGFCDMKPDGWIDHVVIHIGNGEVIEARACSKHLGHLREDCPYNKVVLRPDTVWERQKGFLGWYAIPGVYD